MSSTEQDENEKRVDQLTSAPQSTEADAAPRIDVTHEGGVTRIDVRADASVRPGGSARDLDDGAEGKGAGGV